MQGQMDGVDVPARQRDEPTVRVSTVAWRRWLMRDELGVVVVLVALVLIVGIAHPAFLHKGNLLGIAQNSVYVGLMACGMVFPLAMREVDLSVGGNYALGIVCILVGLVLLIWPRIAASRGTRI